MSRPCSSVRRRRSVTPAARAAKGLSFSSRSESHRLSAALLLTSVLSLGGPSNAGAQTADPNDVGSIGSILTAVYDAISGEAGESRDWDRFRSLFAEGATLSAVARTPAGEIRRVVMTPDSYIERNGRLLERDGFIEAEIGRVTERYAHIAHAFSSYESYRSTSDDEPFARGINSFQLMHDGVRWYVVSIFWQGEGPDFPIPDEYIGDIGPQSP